ncbi:MAG: presqualene diphosphate synthase HpnD [Rhodospirillaceae bacterium]
MNDAGPVNSPAPSQAATDAAAEAVVRASGTTFFWAMRVLPERKRRAMYAVYAFCRVVDDIADEPNPIATKRTELSRWRHEIAGLYGGGASDPIARALIGPVGDFGLRREDFLAVIDGMETDAQDRLRLESMEDLLMYCDRVACAVGRLCCGVFGVGQRRGDDLAASLGLALQLTNILRDLAEDAARDRLYLPRDLLARHGIDTDDPAAVLRHPNLPNAAREIGELAAAKFALARQRIAAMDRSRVKPAIMMMEAYERILIRIRARGWDRVVERASLGRLEKLWVAFRFGVL